MKTIELRNKSIEQLQKDLIELLKTQFGLKMQHATGQLEKNSELKKVRKNIARIKTILSEKAAHDE